MFHEMQVEERPPFITAIQKAFIKQTIGSNESYCLGDKTNGFNSVCLMLPPGVWWPEDQWEVYTSKQEKLLKSRQLNDTYDRFMALEEYFSERFEHYNAIDGYYLLILSTDISCRGQGLASKMMELLAEKLDAEQKSCYLECTNPSLVSFYEKHGFTALERNSLPRIPATIDTKYVPAVTFCKRTPKPLSA
eukprot:gene16098-19155_t